MTNEEMIFLANAKAMCEQNPEMLHHMITAAIQGITEQSRLERERACDFEIVASAMFGLAMEKKRVSAKTREYFESLAMSKIDKWENKNSINWAGYLPGMINET